ncbi:uncharacterized protein LOC134241305 [Saccostrea cucullata]|uniref:uncharacterized protein LOC134241305 n=1 Tax=Saccostrea cuccullata TaxID=36930 RepID=UPI002ED4B9F9
MSIPYTIMAEKNVVADDPHTTEDGVKEETDPEPTEERNTTPSETSEKRVRTLTVKAKELYDAEVKKSNSKIDLIWTDIENIPSEIENIGHNTQALRVLGSRLDYLGDRYEEECVSFREYLTRRNTTESQQELDSLMASLDKGKSIIQELRKRIRDTRMEATETASRRSASVRTSSSHVDSILFKKRVEAETQRANILFREKELAILKEKASLKEHEAKQQAENLKLLITC